MKAPNFWRGPDVSVASILLQPAACLYYFSSVLRHKLASPWKAPTPVICVGNLVAGGAGKTPVVLKLIEMLQERGKIPHALSKGYGGSLVGPTLVDTSHHTYKDTGDEPLLLARRAPTWISIDRAQGAQAAVGADIIVMDDGFQNPSLSKDLSLVVVDGNYGFGNGQIIPAGPLRESITNGLARADAIVLIGEDRANVVEIANKYRNNVPIMQARIVAKLESGELQNHNFHAFAGIGDPSKFFKTLEDFHYKLSRKISFADHHPYNDREISELISNAKKENSVLITTEKDAIRLPPNVRDKVKVLTIDLEWSNEAAINGLLDQLDFNGN